jgi:paired amphipathic helix protein Sin3a
MIPIWKKIYEQNYPRSLDHRSFYFKQAEKKCMMTKFMVSEVKEAADRRKGDDKYLRTLSMAHRHAIPAVAAPQPDLSFTYLDRYVTGSLQLFSTSLLT